jgi:hypothetical protein
MCRVRGSWFGQEEESRTCGSLESQLSIARASGNCRFGNLMKTLFGTQVRRHSRTLGKKQSQSCSPKKSGFRVWTSVRFVNMLGGKDDPVCVHTGNILRGWGCYRHVKVPSSPYKRGRKGTCKRIQTFGNLCYLQRESQSLCALTLYLNVLRTFTRVRVVIRIFRVPPTPLFWFIMTLYLFCSRWDTNLFLTLRLFVRDDIQSCSNYNNKLFWTLLW